MRGGGRFDKGFFFFPQKKIYLNFMGRELETFGIMGDVISRNTLYVCKKNVESEKERERDIEIDC